MENQNEIRIPFASERPERFHMNRIPILNKQNIVIDSQITTNNNKDNCLISLFRGLIFVLIIGVLIGLIFGLLYLIETIR